MINVSVDSPGKISFAGAISFSRYFRLTVID
jgi:hypothetical protein